MNWTVIVLTCLIAFILGVIVLGTIPGIMSDIQDYIRRGGGVSVKPPTSAKALFVKIDPANTPVEIWGFHLTDENRKFSNHHAGSEAFFQIDQDNFSSSFCIIFSVDEHPDYFDASYVYYIIPGAIIQEGCGTNLGICVSGYIDYSGCTLVWETDKFCKDCLYNPLCNPGKVLEQNFVLAGSNKCDKDIRYCPLQGCCNLLQGAPSAPKYKVKYGLICSEEGEWEPCTEATTDPIIVKETRYDCIWDEDRGYGKWEPKKVCEKGKVKGTCLVCNPEETAYVPDATKCPAGQRCNPDGTCVSLGTPLHEFVWMIGEESNCPVPSTWQEYVLTEGTFISDFGTCEPQKCGRVEHKMSKLTIVEGYKLYGKSSFGTDSYMFSCFWFNNPCLCEYKQNGKLETLCTAPIKSNEVAITKACKNIVATGFEIRQLPAGPIIKAGERIKMMKNATGIYIEKIGEVVCTPKQPHPDPILTCRRCNDEGTGWVDDEGLCRYHPDGPYCVDGRCERKPD